MCGKWESPLASAGEMSHAGTETESCFFQVSCGGLKIGSADLDPGLKSFSDKELAATRFSPAYGHTREAKTHVG